MTLASPPAPSRAEMNTAERDRECDSPLSDPPAPSRAEINRRNAAKSTGHRSDAGKKKARFNALRHGLRAKTLVLAGEDEQAYHTRLDAWTAALKPRDDVEDFMVARAVHASWNIERVDRALEARREAARYDDPGRLAALAERVAAIGRRLPWNPTARWPSIPTTPRPTATSTAPPGRATRTTPTTRRGW